jgi:moderate conductance mechanosensitive channel
MDAVRQAVRDLLSPESMATLIERGLEIGVIALLTWVAIRLTGTLFRRVHARSRAGALGTSFILEQILRGTIVGAGLLLTLSVAGLDITPVIASAGVLGLVFSFGAQYIIRDLLAGIFLIMEGTIQPGDVVRINGDTGTVERVSLRITQIRKFSGELLTVPNGTITRIGNLSRDYMRAVVQFLVPYRVDMNAALEALKDAAEAWTAAHTKDKQADPVINGIVDLRDYGAVAQLSVLVVPGRQDATASELRQLTLDAMARRGITPGAVVPLAPQSPGGRGDASAQAGSDGVP